jgi:hypothetical protein
MPGKVLEDRMRPALGIHTPRQMVNEALDGLADGSDVVQFESSASPRHGTRRAPHIDKH